jgi:hypothetical protein
MGGDAVTTQRLLLAEPPDSSIPTAAPDLRETFRVLDVVGSGWIVVLSFTTLAPPLVPQQGDAYLVPAGATGAWSGHQNHLAIFTPTGWIFRSPRFGWIAVIVDQNAPYGRVLQYTGTEWTGWILPASQVSFSVAGTDFVSTTLQALMLEINLRFLSNETRLDVLEAGGGGGSGSYAFVAGAAVTGSAATTMTVSGLDLDADVSYIVHVEVKNATGSGGNVAMFYNSDTTATNYDNQVLLVLGGTTFAVRNNDANIMGFDGSTSSSAEIAVTRQIGGKVAALVTGCHNDGTSITIRDEAHQWRTTGANVTGITISASVANSLAVGSNIQVWKRST